MIVEKSVTFTLKDKETELLKNTIEFLEKIEGGLGDCYEFSINGDYCNVEIITDTIDFLKNLCYGSEIEGYLREEY